MRFFRVLCGELMRSPQLYCAAALFLLLCASGNAVFLDENQYSVLELITNRTLYRQALSKPDITGYTLWLAFDASPWFAAASAVITGAPILRIAELFSGKMRYAALPRGSRRQYIAGMFLTAFLSGVLISLAGILLYGAAVYVMFPAFGENVPEFIAVAYGTTAGARALAFTKKLLNCCCMNGIFPLLTILLYPLLRDHFLTVTLPMMLEYVSIKCDVLYSSRVFGWQTGEPETRFYVIGLLFPSNYMLHSLYWENFLHLPFACFFGVWGILMLLLYAACTKIWQLEIGECL